jgi:hypothetical protein
VPPEYQQVLRGIGHGIDVSVATCSTVCSAWARRSNFWNCPSRAL